ncbi:MAG: NAD-dependent DNA ligase LigA [Candidatus Avilachnospira sp.]
MENKTERMKYLVSVLNEASKAYYAEGVEKISNFEYDKLYDELLELERETGTVFSNSPSQNVGYEVISELPKERHESPMLSLDKTKSVSDLEDWLSGKEGILSWKLDGLTVVLTYEGGELVKAVTRGNGEIGEVITANAKRFDNLPLKIGFKGKLVIRGEAVIKYSDFEKINEEIAEADAKYKNPRNLCSGSVRQLDPGITGKRHVNLVAFALVSAEEEGKEPDFGNSFERRFDWLSEQGFTVVEHKKVTAETVREAVEYFKEKTAENDYPSDGLVLAYEDIAYGISLGRTAKFPRNAIAFKWTDETAETRLKYIEWSASRTGLINPVAVFEPVELEGTTVSRASVHNLSIVEELELGEGDVLKVYKANMIIPQIAENLSRTKSIKPPRLCPVCGAHTEIRKDNDAAYLYCPNPECPAKKLKSFALMVSRDALNVEGLSEMRLERFISEGFIHEYADIFKLDRFRERIVEMEGFGEKSYNNLEEACRKAADTELYRLVYGLGISGIGLAGAKLLCREFKNDFEAMRNTDEERLKEIDGIGEVTAAAWVRFFEDPRNNAEVDELLKVLSLKDDSEKDSGNTTSGTDLSGLTFVITGEVNYFKNRRELQDTIEKLGGKATSSVSKSTNYLINNDINSTSNKNKNAKKFGVPIITEDDFLKMIHLK